MILLADDVSDTRGAREFWCYCSCRLIESRVKSRCSRAKAVVKLEAGVGVYRAVIYDCMFVGFLTTMIFCGKL